VERSSKAYTGGLAGRHESQVPCTQIRIDLLMTAIVAVPCASLSTFAPVEHDFDAASVGEFLREELIELRIGPGDDVEMADLARAGL
jgi:hypothetical protein